MANFSVVLGFSVPLAASNQLSLGLNGRFSGLQLEMARRQMVDTHERAARTGHQRKTGTKSHKHEEPQARSAA
jgi:hypothetical protein